VTERTGSLAALLAALALGACREGPPAPGEAPPRRDHAPAASGSASAAPPPASASAPAAAPEPETLTGTWEGHYEAKKGTVAVPPRVKDKSFAKDKGTVAVGPGSVTITVAPDGALSGKGKGALGAISLTGKAEGDMIRASILPDDPSAANAMTGVLVGMLKEGAITGEIHVAGPDATMVRDAAITLKRK
jgi:hypothetical protein